MKNASSKSPNTLSAGERLKSKKRIDRLFEKGKWLRVSPLSLVWMQTDLPDAEPLQVAFSVPVRKMRRAVDRNRTKRLMREAYRLHKHPLHQKLQAQGTQLAMMLIYSDTRLPEYNAVKKKINHALQRLINSL